MDTSKKCCKRRCQQQALAQRQMCKQHTGQCLPHLIPVRPVRQQNSTQVLLAEQKLTETPNIEEKQSQNCFNGSDPHLDTSSSPDCAPACKITYYELRKQQKQQQQQQQQQNLSCNANINYPTKMRTFMQNMQEQPQNIEMPRQKICRCGRVKKQQNVTVNAYQEVAPNNDALKRSKPCGKGASAADLHTIMNELASLQPPTDNPIRKKPCNCSRKNEMLMSKSENAFPKAETHQHCQKNNNRGQLPCNSVHNMQTCNAGQSFVNKCSHPPVQSSLPTSGRSCGNMHTSCNKQPTMSSRPQTCSSKAESIYGTPESMGSYDTCPKTSCGKQKSEIQIKPLCELQGNDAIGKSFYATPSNSSPCQQANFNQMSTPKVCKRFPSNTPSKTSCSPSKHSLYKPCNQPRPESSSTALHTTCGQQAYQAPCGQPKPQSSNIALQKSCDRQKSHASCGRAKPQASKTELQMPCTQTKSQTFSSPSQKSCGRVKTQPSNAALQMPCGQASKATLQMPCGQAKSQASHVGLQMPCGAKSQSLNIPSQKSCHMKPQASNIGLQMPCGEKKSQMLNTPSQKSCGQAKSQASNAAQHMPCGFTKSQTLNVPSQKSCGHAKSQVCNVGAPMPCGHAQSQNLNVSSQKSCGHMKSQTCNAPSQKPCGQMKSKASNMASQNQCGKSKSQQSHMPCKRSKSEVFYSPASSDGEDNDRTCPEKKTCSKLNEAKARSLAILKLLHEVVHLINEDHPEENPCSYSMLERELSHDMPKSMPSSPCKNVQVEQQEISPCSKSTISPCSEPIEAPCSQPAKMPCSEPAKMPCSEPSPCSKPPPLATLPCNLIISPDMQITIAQILAGGAPPQTALSAAMKPPPCAKDLESTTDTSIGTEEKCWQSTLVKSFYHDSIDTSQMDLPCSCSYEMNEATEYEEQPHHIDNNNALFKEQGGYEEMSYNRDTGGSAAEEENYPNVLNIYEPQAAEEDNYPNMLNIYEAQSVRDTTETSSDGVKAAFVTIIEELVTPCNMIDNSPCNLGNNMGNDMGNNMGNDMGNNMGNNAPCGPNHCSQEDLRVRRDLLCSQPRGEEQCDCTDNEPEQNVVDKGCNMPPPPQDSCSGNKEIIMPQQCPDECDEPVFIDEPCDDGSDDKNTGTCSDTDNERVPICGKEMKENQGDDCKCCHCRAMRECPNEHNMQLVRTDSCTEDKPPKNDDDMKFFINSIIMDLEAMEYARRTKNNDRKLFAKKKKTGPCNSFPVTITDVSELGATSLYVKWEIEDCSNISGYEIFVDGFLTNRYFNCSHTAAVICDVDVTAPHKIILVAQPYMNEECLCPKSTESEKNMDFNANKSVVKRGLTMPTLNPSALWTPSVYFYDPPEYCKAPDISRECDFE
ncbi:uncharacterized protein LOC119679973 isoform X2 [Teleopsis dalmanni]|uniref:uncharacterized protein LOC119679973 isoform X2 n=1 Tax=Teleopsis dalmanni TaxID=139649 RepID=UPI0018CDF87F|nr:uncharacterized protein LOC119679973 isoform X2 [Teleopsis dalmanni]